MPIEYLPSAFARVALDNVARAYPRRLDQLVAGPDAEWRPGVLHPAFYGSYDWHSSVHMHWLLVHLLRQHRGEVAADDVRRVLDAHLAPDALATEAAYLRAHPSFERPYGWAWLAALAEQVRRGPSETVVCGDMNIAPTDEDVFDPEAYIGQTHVTTPEREALAQLQAVGLRDVVRDRWPDKRVFTYWDYRAGMFHQDLGMRIDLVLATAAVSDRVRAAWVDRQARKGSGPSDHAPVMVDLDEAPDGDIGPVVPPPSAPATRKVTLPQNR